MLMVTVAIESIARAEATSPFNGLLIASANVIAETPDQKVCLGQRIQVVVPCGCTLSRIRPGETGRAIWCVARSLAEGATQDELTPAHWCLCPRRRRHHQTPDPATVDRAAQYWQ